VPAQYSGHAVAGDARPVHRRCRLWQLLQAGAHLQQRSSRTWLLYPLLNVPVNMQWHLCRVGQEMFWFLSCTGALARGQCRSSYQPGWVTPDHALDLRNAQPQVLHELDLHARHSALSSAGCNGMGPHTCVDGLDSMCISTLAQMSVSLILDHSPSLTLGSQSRRGCAVSAAGWARSTAASSPTGTPADASHPHTCCTCCAKTSAASAAVAASSSSASASNCRIPRDISVPTAVSLPVLLAGPAFSRAAAALSRLRSSSSSSPRLRFDCFGTKPSCAVPLPAPCRADVAVAAACWVSPRPLSDGSWLACLSALGGLLCRRAILGGWRLRCCGC
jgi:hypothetical protein